MKAERVNKTESRSGKSASRGFTLIELLVVISIIALLLAILMPALSKARELAPAAAGMSNMHQWAVMLKLYTDDNDGKYPDNATGWRNGVWIASLWDYFEDDIEGGILMCPSAENRWQNVDETQWKGAHAQGGTYQSFAFPNTKGSMDTSDIDEDNPILTASYGVNNWICNPSKDSIPGTELPADPHWRTPYQKRASEIPQMGDCGWRGGFPYQHGRRYQRSEPYSTQNPNPLTDSERGAGKSMANFAMDRHSGGINMCFMDGSTRKVAIKELWTLNWSKDWEPCNIYTECGENSYEWPEWMRNYPSY